MKFLIVYLIFATAAYAQECPTLSDKLGRAVDAHIKELQGVELCGGRFVASSGNTEVVLYSVEGACIGLDAPAGSCGNTFDQYLSAVVDSKSIAPFNFVGFAVSEMELRDGKVYLKGKKLGKNDARCCPSVDADAVLSISEAGFKRL